MEARGVEPLSENRSIKLSTGVFRSYLSQAVPVRTRKRLSSTFIRDRYKCELAVHVHCCVMPLAYAEHAPRAEALNHIGFTGVAVLSGRTVAHLGSYEFSIIISVYFLKFGPL